MSDEDIRAKAVEAVRQHLDLSEKTRIRTSVRTSVGIIIAIVTGTVAVCTYLNRISTSQDRMESSLNYKVSIHQFETWVSALDHQNRQTVPALVVPLPIDHPDKAE